MWGEPKPLLDIMPDTSTILESTSRQRLFVILISIAAFMGTLDSTIVNISLPSIAEYYDTSVTMVSWIPIAYLLTLAAAMIAFGCYADLHGHRKVYLSGFGIFTVASPLCALSPTIEVMIGCRIVQGLGAAMLQAIGGAMIAIYLPREVRGRALGMMATFASLGIVVGPGLGGVLTQFASWQWIFFVNIPVGIGAILLGRMVMPPDRPDVRPDCAFDLSGAVLLFVTLASLIFSLSMGKTLGFLSPVILASAVLFIAGAAIFLYRESHVQNPLIRLSIFRNRDYSLSTFGAICVFFIYMGTSFLLPFYLEQGRGYSTEIAGLFMMVPAIAMLVIATLAGRTADRIGSQALCIASGALFIITMFLFSLLSTETPIVFLIVNLILFGTAMGLYTAPNTRLLMSHAVRGEEGLVSSITMTVKNIGSSLGVAIFSLLFVYASGKIFTGIIITDSQRNTGLHAAFIFGCAVAVIILVTAILSHEKQAGISPVVIRDEQRIR